MNIYVKSCGLSKGYCWLQETKGEIVDPPNLKLVSQMVDSDDFSLLLYRLEGQLSLLVTGLKTKNRTDNRTRRIRNSVLWVGKDSDEATLRSLSIQALNGELEAKVDEAVASENNAQGFTVNFDLLKPEKLGLQSVGNQPADPKEHKVGNLSACKDELIDDLKKYALPKDDGMLVVVSSTVSKSSLERERVWRGLSDAISDEDWIDLSVKEDKGDNFRRQAFSSGTTSKDSLDLPIPSPTSSRSDKKIPEASPLKKWIPTIVAFVVGLLIGIVGHYLYYSNIPNMQKKQIEDNETTIKNQKETITNQEETINKQKDTIAKKAETIKQEEKLINDILIYTNNFTERGAPLIERAKNFTNGIQK